MKRIITADNQVLEQNAFLAKGIMTSAECAKYLGLSLSYLYKLTSARKIPHYKPIGKLVYFNRQEIDEWLQSHKVATGEELDAQARSYCKGR